MKRNNDLRTIVLFAVLTIIFCVPIIISNTNLGIQDWDQHFAYLETARKTVLEYKQFPFWNPYHCGGIPGFGNPQSKIISITFLLVLLLGTVIGVKVSILLHYFIGLLGFYYLIQHFNLSKPAKVISSIIFMFSGVLSSALATGMIPFLPMSYLPWTWLFLLKSEKKKIVVWRYVFLTSLTMALSYYEGYHIMIVFFPLLFIFSLLKEIKNKSNFYIRQVLLIGVFFVIISAPKMILNVELMKDFPRKTTESSGYSPKGLIYFLLWENQNIHNNLSIKNFGWGVDENSLYVGYLPLLFFLVGVFKYWEKRKEYLFSLIIIFILMLGNNSFVNLFNLIRKLPFYDSFRVAQRFRFDFILMFAIFSAYGIEFFIKNKILKKKWLTPLIILIYADLLIFSHENFFTKSFIIENPDQKITKKEPIRQVATYNIDYQYDDKNFFLEDGLKNTLAYSIWGNEYLATKNNIGTINCYEAIEIPKRVLSYENKNYQGEFFLNKKNGSLKLKEWSPNKIIFNADIKADDLLIINQNYSNKWVVFTDGKKQPIISFRGLISAPLKKGDRIIILAYEPYKIK